MNVNVTVIGNVFIDIKGFASDSYNPQGKNIGTVKFVHGGVGRNVAETLADLGVPTRLVCTVNDNGLGHEVIERLKSKGVDTEYVRFYDEGMGMWLAILDDQGNLAGGISHQPNFSGLNDLVEHHGHEIISSSSHVVLSIDLTEQITRKTIELAKMYRKPIYGLPGNFQIVMKHPELLEGMDCFICNHVEAGRLVDVAFEGLSMQEMIEKLVEFVHAHSLGAMVVTLGAEGSVFYDRSTGSKGHQPIFPVNMVDSSGAGDAFFAGTVMGLVRGLPLEQAVICGTKVAGWVVESEENNCRDLRETMVLDAFFARYLN